MAKADPIHKITAPKGDLLLRRMTVHEELGRPFQFEIEAYSEESNLSAYDFLGKSICVSLRRPDSSTRYFHGLVSRFLNVGRFNNYHVYHFIAKPWLWFLSHTADCRIFQGMTVPNIVTQVCKDHGFSDLKTSLQSTYPAREYCAQYRESTYAFVSRLLEQEGIYYFFEHDAAKHTMVLVDSPSAHKRIDGGQGLNYRPPGESRVGEEHISRWRRGYELRSGAVVLDDFDFIKPNVELRSQATTSRQHALADLEVFDYPGRYLEVSEGTTYAKTRMEEISASHCQVEATGDAQGMMVGGKFELREFPRKDQNGEYLIVGASIEIESGEVEQLGATENKFRAHITAIDAKVPYRPPRVTPKAVVNGPQTAIVVGKSGEEIWTDSHGRVKVQFHWDRYGKTDENSSCWLRVAQTWAGKNWGAIHIPRIGQEVIVDFLEGDPDRPLITGRVYNAEQPPPYSLPDNATQSGFLTRTSKEGNAKLANELRFEDKKDAEEIHLHAQKDFNRVVENNDSVRVGFDKHDKGDRTVEVFNNQKVTVGCADAEDGSQEVTVWRNHTETIKEGDRKVVVTTGNDTHDVQKGDRSVIVGLGNDTLTIKSGNQTVKLNVGKSTLDAMQGIELKCGGSSISIKPDGITISGLKISINGQVQTQLQGAITQVKGSGMLKLQAGVVVIN